MRAFNSRRMGQGLLGAGLLPALTEAAAVQLGNGSFETGAFALRWTTLGTASVVTALFGQAPTGGIDQAFISNVPFSPETNTAAIFPALRRPIPGQSIVL